MRGCDSCCGENSKEPTCSVKDKELNEELGNSWLFWKESCS